MNDTQRFIVYLLSCAIRGQKIQDTGFKEIDWSSVYNEANSHQIDEIIFPSIKDLDERIRPDDAILNKWSRDALMRGYSLSIRIENMASVLKAFNDSGIPVISLKGLSLRELYPQPTMRSMSDADILIHQEDFEKAKLLLLSHGYFTQIDTNAKEVRFFHKTNLMIELHWLLIEPGYIANSEKLEKSAWDNVKKSTLSGVPIYILSDEDNVIYLLLHMVLHMMNSGFGLRQLSDLVLLIETKKELINWDTFNQRIREYKIEKFTDMVLLVCERLLNLKIPYAISMDQRKEDVVNSLIDDILSAGVFGQKTSERAFIKDTIDRSGMAEVFPSKTKHYLFNIFPTGRSLADRFNYAAKHPILLPIAWVHRLIYNIIHNKNFKTQFNFRFKVPEGAKEVYYERMNILKKLGLK